MSAFVVNKAHINAIIRAGLSIRDGVSWYTNHEHHKLNELTADATGQMLIDACVHSVMARYADSKITDLPGPNNAYWLIPYVYEYDLEAKTPTGVEAIKLARCYEYQSCEADDWKGSEAKEFIEAFIVYMYDRLPGYDDAPWGWEDKPQVKHTVKRMV